MRKLKMKKPDFNKLANNLKQFGAGFLLVAFCLQIFSFTTTAQFVKSRNAERKVDETLSDEAPGERIAKNKIAPDLEEKTDGLFHNLRRNETQKVIIQLKSETPLNKMFGNSLSESEQEQMFGEEVRRNKEKTGMPI
jgi:hypothetical protein